MVPYSDLTHHVPMSPQQIIEEVHQADTLGITIAHLHARAEDKSPTHELRFFSEIMEGVRKHCPELVISATLSGRYVSDWAQRAEALATYPDMGSLTLSSLNFPKAASVNAPDIIQKLALAMKDNGVTPELECFDLGMVNYGRYLIRKGILEASFYWNLLFGNVAGAQADALSIGTLVREVPEGGHIALAGIGDAQLPVNAMAVAMGYGVRVGLEDNLWYDKQRTRLATNMDLLKRVHALAAIHQRKVMTARKFGGMGFYNSRTKDKLASLCLA